MGVELYSFLITDSSLCTRDFHMLYLLFPAFFLMARNPSKCSIWVFIYPRKDSCIELLQLCVQMTKAFRTMLNWKICTKKGRHLEIILCFILGFASIIKHEHSNFSRNCWTLWCKWCQALKRLVKVMLTFLFLHIFNETICAVFRGKEQLWPALDYFTMLSKDKEV